MSDPGEARYRRLLRWYPRAWRAAHGEVVMGTLMDASQALGRRRPTAGEAWSLRVHGLGERLTARAGVLFAGAGFVVFVFGAAGYMTVLVPLSATGLGWLLPALTVFVGSALLSLAGCGLLRSADAVSPPRAVLVAGLAIVAWALALAATLSWSVGFDEADERVTSSPFARLFPLFFGAACLVGAIAIALVLAPALRGLRPAWARVSVAVLAGAVAGPVLGLVALMPTIAPIAALGVLLLALRTAAHERAETGKLERSTARPVVRPPVPRGIRRRVALLSWTSAALAIAGIAFAMSGSLWPGVEADSTRTMQLGLAAGALAGVPLLIGAGIALTSWGIDARRAWAPLTAFALALLVGTSGAFAGDPSSQLTLMIISGALAGTGVGAATYALVRGARSVRALIGLAAGAVFAVTVGLPFAVAAAFAAPLAGIALGIWGLREPRSGTSAVRAPRAIAG